MNTDLKKEKIEFEKRIDQLGFDQKELVYCLGIDIAEKTPTPVAETYSFPVRDALSRFNGETPEEVIKNLTLKESKILIIAQRCYDGDLAVMQEEYINQCLDKFENFVYTALDKLGEKLVNIASIEAMLRYENRHRIKLLQTMLCDN